MPGDAQGVSVPLSLFGGLVTELSAPDLPEGVSPDNQDVVFLPGSVSSRPGLHKVYSSAISGNVTIVYQKTYVQPNGNPINLILDSAGNLWKEDVINAPGTLTSLGTVASGSYAQSCSAFGREYLAISDGVHGADVPLQFDGKFLDRVTQDGPAVSPTISSASPPSATIQGVGVPVTITIAGSPNGIIWQDPFFYSFGGGAYWYRDFKVTTTSAHGLTTGQTVTISGSTSTPSVNGTWGNIVVTSSTTFQVGHNVPVTGAANGGGGSCGQTTGSGTSLTRASNSVIAVTSADHGFQVGWNVQISGIANTNVGGGISAISRDGNGIVTVTTASAHGVPAGALIAIAGVTDTSYDGTFTVATVPGPTQLTFVQAGAVSSSSGGNVQDIWDTTAIIQSVPSTTSFTYQQVGPNDTTTGTGTATILGQVSAGTHECVVMFLTRQGYLTAPSPPVQFVANGTSQIGLSNIPVGPPNVVARVLGFTGAGGANFFTLLTTPFVNGQIVGSSLVINDNTSTSAIVDFPDNALFAGTGIDILGRNQFAQVVLAPVIGFFGYASRLFTWGELNKIQTLVNMGFDGGVLPVPTTNRAGSGANGGVGTAWTNPNNVTSTSSYADLSLAAFGSSQNLVCETFAFAVTGTVYGFSFSFDTYGTISGAGSLRYTVTLLKAGVPVGSPQILVMPNTEGSAGSPISFTGNFAASGFTAADVNGSTFGLQIQVTEFEVASTATCHIRNVQITASMLSGLPLGWTSIGLSGGTTGGTGIIVPVTTPPGFAYQMTGIGLSFDAYLTQPAYLDPFGIQKLSVNTQYMMRVKASSATPLTGHLRVQLASLDEGWACTASIDVSTLTPTMRFVSATFDGPTGAAIGPQATIAVYLDAVTGTITIDELEIAPAVTPYRDSLARGSYVNGPEQFDGVTGDIGPSTDTSPLRCFFEFRDVLYMDTARARHETIDNSTGEPSTWTVRELSQSVGALSLKSSDTGMLGTGDSAEQFEFTASRGGAYIFWGGEMIKVSQEIQNVWDTINFNAKQTVWIKNDPVVRRCYFGLPLGTATAPNTILVLDYRELNTPEAIASTAPFRQSYNGRMIATELARKWTKWNIASNSAEILTLPNSMQTVTFGAGNGQTPGTANGFGNIYYLDAVKLTDDDYGQIVPYWTSYFFVSDDQAQALQLDTHRKLATYLALFISGTGQTSITPLSDVLTNAYPQLAAYPLSTTQNHDLEWPINVDGECIALKVGSVPLTGQTDNGFTLQKMILTLKKHPWSALRGAI